MAGEGSCGEPELSEGTDLLRERLAKISDGAGERTGRSGYDTFEESHCAVTEQRMAELEEIKKKGIGPNDRTVFFCGWNCRCCYISAASSDF